MNNVGDKKIEADFNKIASEHYREGVLKAVKLLEKKASYISWIQNTGFREKFQENVTKLIKSS